MESNIGYEFLGIAEVLSRYRLRVPPNQREYSWGENGEVRELLVDISNAVRKGSGSSHFLGTIVLTPTKDEALEIADGQQRLATTTIILSYIRDYFLETDDEKSAKSIENEYLFKYDIKAKDVLPRLTLNLDDNVFFRDRILQVSSSSTSVSATRKSHELISAAQKEIKDHFEAIKTQLGMYFQETLIEYLEFIKTRVNVVVLHVLNNANAFTLFETLNDRGLKTSQADLVKNHLFGKAVDRYEEAQSHWSRMRGAIDTIGEDGDFTLDFLRLACCLLSGATREKDIMEKMSKESSTKSEALTMLLFLDELSTDYAAILNPDHPKWNSYDESVRKAIKTINLIGVTQIRPLILAISKHFTTAQTSKAFRRLVSWSVRILIGGTRGGKLDEAYARIANEIHNKKIKSDEELSKLSIGFVPTDAQFKKSFEVARVSVNRLARYYLRSLETTARGERDPEFVPNEDLAINLEHIMSQVPNQSTSAQDIETHFTRIGNLALIKAERNSSIGSLPFDEKRETYLESSFLLTQQVGEVETWNTTAIEERQKKLAELAVETWSND